MRPASSLAAALCTLGLAVPALADTRVINGTLDASDPTMPVVAITAPNCTAQGVFPVHFDAYPFFVTQDGTYDFEMTSTGSTPGFASLYLMDETFDPAAAFPSCLAGDNGVDPVGFSLALTANTPYFVVPFDDQFDQPGGSYTLTIEGPGVIVVENIGLTPTIPTLSQWGLGLLAGLLALWGAATVRHRRAA